MVECSGLSCWYERPQFFHSPPPSRWQITIVIQFLPGENITTSTVSKGKILPWGELLVITPEGILFISQTDLVKYLQMPVNASNPKKFPLFTQKGHPRFCWVVWIILQLQRTAIKNASTNTIDKIDTIDTIDRIDWNNQYKDNRYNWSYQLTLQTSPAQLHHCFLLFWFD